MPALSPPSRVCVREVGVDVEAEAVVWATCHLRLTFARGRWWWWRVERPVEVGWMLELYIIIKYLCYSPVVPAVTAFSSGCWCLEVCS